MNMKKGIFYAEKPPHLRIAKHGGLCYNKLIFCTRG